MKLKGKNFDKYLSLFVLIIFFNFINKMEIGWVLYINFINVR